MKLNVTLDIDSHKKALGAVAPEILRKAERSALRKIAGQGKTAASRQIRSDYNLKAKDVDSKIKVDSRGGVAYVDLTATTNSLNLIYFNPKDYRQTAGRTRVTTRGGSKVLKRGGKEAGVYVKIKGGKTVFLPHAWIMSGNGGVTMVMKRTGKGKSRYQKAALVTVSTLLAGNKPIESIQVVVAQKFGGVLSNEYQYYLSQQR